MQRVTVSLEETLAAEFDALAHEQGYQSRSEAVRDLVRRAVEQRRLQSGAGQCIANLSYVYDHHTRSLAGRLATLQHDRHELIVSTSHVHLDRHTCLESTFLRGPVDAVRQLGDEIQAERGVRFGTLNLITAQQEDLQAHGHSHAKKAPR